MLLAVTFILLSNSEIVVAWKIKDSRQKIQRNKGR